jgi:hypothetical protein
MQEAIAKTHASMIMEVQRWVLNMEYRNFLKSTKF